MKNILTILKVNYRRRSFFRTLVFVFLIVSLLICPLPSSAEKIDFNAMSLDELFYKLHAVKLDGNSIKIRKISMEDADVLIPEEIEGKKVVSMQLNDEYDHVKTISIPKNMKRIVPYEEGFYFPNDFFSNLNCIKVDPENKVYGSFNGMLYKKSQKTLLVCPVKYQGTDVKIPKYISVIKKSAFSGCVNIRTMTIGSNVKEIQSSFSYMPNLEEVSIKGSVKKILERSFWKCKKLKKVNLHKGIKSIGDKAFKGCKSLKKVVVPKSTKIAKNAFPKTCKVIRK